MLNQHQLSVLWLVGPSAYNPVGIYVMPRHAHSALMDQNKY